MASREQIKRNLLETIKKIDNILSQYGIYDLSQEEQKDFSDRLFKRLDEAKEKLEDQKVLGGNKFGNNLQ